MITMGSKEEFIDYEAAWRSHISLPESISSQSHHTKGELHVRTCASTLLWSGGMSIEAFQILSQVFMGHPCMMTFIAIGLQISLEHEQGMLYVHV